ncbi:hypothetical protein GCM10009092_00360 [Bowmanella denitrificans]|uniref:Uncharacterized protein n=1 Tax=Bowmanella denitrificans TaxID=366582 RepID=A0ABN0WJQ6_9ALTE
MEANGISLPRALKLFFLSVTVISVLLVGLLLGFFWLLGQGMCGNHLFSQTISPDGRHKVVVFERSCGATTGFSTHVSVLNWDDHLPNEKGNILILDGSPKDVAPNHVWQNNNTVVIQAAPDDGKLVTDQLYRGSALIYIKFAQ